MFKRKSGGAILNVTDATNKNNSFVIYTLTFVCRADTGSSISINHRAAMPKLSVSFSSFYFF